MPRCRIRTCFACSEQEVRRFNGKVYGKQETTPNSGIVYFLACQRALFRLSGDWCTSHGAVCVPLGGEWYMFEGAVERWTFFHLHRLAKRPLDIPKDGACYRRDARKPSGVMRVSGGRWGGVFLCVLCLLCAEAFAVTKLQNNFHFSKFRMAETGENPPWNRP